MNRLKSFRQINRITQEELGNLLSVSPALISAIESGRRPRTFDLDLLGYSNDRFELTAMSEPMHRQRASTLTTSTNRAKELLRVAGETLIALSAANPNVPAPMLQRIPEPMSDNEIEAAALDVRAMLGVEESGPIQNLTSAVERAGICLVPIVGLKGVDGISTWVETTPVVGLSPTVPGDRFRFSLAHELAHLTMHRIWNGNTEDAANRCAGAVLIPEQDITSALPDTPMLSDFAAVKNSWGISIAALVYRSHQLGMVDDRRYRALQIQMSKWRKQEPGTFKPAYGTLLSRLVETAGGPDVVAGDIGIPASHIREVTTWSHLRAA